MGRNFDYCTKRKIVFGVLIFLGLTLLCLITNLFSFYKNFLLGVFGLITYPAIIIAIAFCVLYVMNKVIRFERKPLALSMAVLCLFLCILQMALTSSLDFTSFSTFVSESYQSKSTPAGALFSVIIFPFKYFLFDIGAYIVFSIAIIALIAFMVDMYYDRSKSTEKSVGARVEKFEPAQKQSSTMGLVAGADRVSSNNAYKYADFNTNGVTPKQSGGAVENTTNNYYSSTTNESITNGSFDSNGNNIVENFQVSPNSDINNNATNSFSQTTQFVQSNAEGNLQGNAKDTQTQTKEQSKLLSDKIKAKLGLIDAVEEDDEEDDGFESGKSEAFKTLYPQKFKKKDDYPSGGKSSLNSLSRYFDNSSTRGKKVNDEEYRAKYREYTTQNYNIGYNIGYNNLNNAVSGTSINTSPFDGIINGEEYKKKSKPTTSSIFSEKDKQKSDDVIGGIKRDVNVRKKVIEKRIGDSLILTEVEVFDESPVTPNNYTGENVADIDTFNYGGQAGIINGADYKRNSSVSATTQTDNASTTNTLATPQTNTMEDAIPLTSSGGVNAIDDNFINPNPIINASEYKSNSTAKNAENCIKSNVDVVPQKEDEKQQPAKEQINTIKPILKVEGEEVALNDADLTPFAKETETVQNQDVQAENNDDALVESSADTSELKPRKSATILPKCENLAINTECETENQVDDEKLFNEFDDISLSPSNHYNEETESTVGQISGGSAISETIQNESLFQGSDEVEQQEQLQETNANSAISDDSASASSPQEESTNAVVASGKENEVKPLKSVFEKQREREKELEEAQKPYIPPKPYNHPPVEYLTVESTDMSDLVDDTEHKSAVLEASLESFKVPAKVSNTVVGPTVTRYEMTMPAGISVKKIVNYSDDIAMALEARGAIRIEAPIPGKNAVGIEVPNDKSAVIGFKEVFESGDFYRSENPLNFVLGKDINGDFIFCNLAKAPHLLVAGSTGSGKSVCLNILILSIIYKSSPEDVRLVLIDPKRVEFAIYEGLPHLMLPNIITEPEKAVNTFTWAINEMEKRYTLFQSHRVRDIGEYNQLPDIVAKKKPKMPYIVIIVDELADLMTVCKKELEEKIARIAAKARSAGIHLVLATQRPSTDIITGTIKNNFPTRIAFSLTSYADSKTILDQSGAEKLLGKGDMLYAPQDKNEPIRIQAPFVTGAEINQVVDYVKEHNDACYDDNIVNKMLNKGGGGESRAVGVKDPTADEMFVPALKVFIESNQASSSMLQRRLSLGWNRASKLTDAMEDMGYISKADNNNRRQILITKEQFRELYGDID